MSLNCARPHQDKSSNDNTSLYRTSKLTLEEIDVMFGDQVIDHTLQKDVIAATKPTISETENVDVEITSKA